MWTVAAMALALNACQPCHTAQAKAHAATGHAQALRRAAEHPLRTAFPLDREYRRGPRFRFRFDGLTVRVDDGTDVLAVPMEWAFGAGAQAVTFVSRADDAFHLEHFLSYYWALRNFGPTPGHAALKPANLAEAAGLLYKTRDPVAGIDGCFDCHSTGPAREPGVQCEACHASSKPGVHASNPRALSAAKLNDFCGRCHRPPAADPAKIDWNYAWNVRHQPVYLSQSRCFAKSAGRLSCLTCHAAHAPLATAASHYDAQCASCHAPSQRAGVCAPRDCAGCHMPRVSPEPPLRFANHWIGVYPAAGAKLRPRGYTR